MIIAERNEHLDLLYQSLISKVQHLIVLRGGLNAKEMKLAMNQLNYIPFDEERVLLATGKFIGEGFDDARLDTLFLTLPISWKGTITQYIGRLHRLYDSKKKYKCMIMRILPFQCLSVCSTVVVKLTKQPDTK